MAMFNPNEFCIKEEYVRLLDDYQIERIDNLVRDFIKSNEECTSHEIEYCPKCGCNSPLTNKAGLTQKGKQMYLCKACDHRFVYDTGCLTFYSHQSLAKWIRFIEMTLEKKSLAECAASLHINKSTAFRMRHKLMAFIRMIQTGDVISGLCEVDETYIHANQKGLISKEIGEMYYQKFCLHSLLHSIYKHYGQASGMECMNKIEDLDYTIKVQLGWERKNSSTKRGISKDLVCIFTGIERQGDSFYHASNLGKPNQEEINEFISHVEPGSHVWVDGLPGYGNALQSNDCTYTVCPTSENYTVLDHLNNVNAVHRDFKEWIKKYRGVSTIYSDRYASMISYVYDHRSEEESERRNSLIRDLNKHQIYFYVKDISSKDILVFPEDQAARAKLTSIAKQRRRSAANPMTMEAAMALIRA